MAKIDLITGFLGSGKTTFLKLYTRYLLGKGMRIGILENDYGAVNVDMLLHRELESDRCGLEMVAGACDADCHKRRFKTKLIALGMSGYDRVLIEPSGVFDTDEFFDTLYEEPLDRFFEAGSVIAVADADLDDDLSEAADYYLASQIAGAGVVVLSKTQTATEAQKQSTLAHIERALKSVRCDKRLSGNILAKDWAELTDKDFERVMNSGYDCADFVKRGVSDDSGFRSLYLINKAYTVEELSEKARAAFGSGECGRIFRVKGFVKHDGGWLEFNATGKQTDIRPIEHGQDIVIVIGDGLNETKIKKIFK